MDWLRIALYLTFWTGLVWAAYTDARRRIIPDRSWMLVAAAGALLLASPVQSLLGALVCGGFLLLLAMVNESWVGGGDIKLMAALGASLGLGALWVMWLACLLALVYVAVRRQRSAPFAPFVLLATAGVECIEGMV